MMGSGETAPNVRRAYEWMFERIEDPIRVAVMETPAGFEPNSYAVAAELAEYVQVSLQNFHPTVEVIPARKKGTAFSPDDPEIVEPLYRANVIMSGPGSPTYAARQFRDSLAWQVMIARYLLGANVVFSSAMTLAASRFTMPVYEIYKVGEDLHWQDGLNLLGLFGLSTVHVPHWNTNSGGAEVDTTRCYVGQGRYQQMVEMLPPGQRIVGLDDHTAIVIQPGTRQVRVIGVGTCTLPQAENEALKFKDGDSFSAEQLGPWRDLETVPNWITPEVWEKAVALQGEMDSAPDVPAEIHALNEEREQARAARDWAQSDALRDQMEALGWRVVDTPDGPELHSLETETEG